MKSPNSKFLKSTAQEGAFLFAQTVEGGKCHLSFSAENAFNIQIRMEQVPGMIKNLLDTLDAERIWYFEETVRLKDELEHPEEPDSQI